MTEHADRTLQTRWRRLPTAAKSAVTLTGLFVCLMLAVNLMASVSRATDGPASGAVAFSDSDAFSQKYGEEGASLIRLCRDEALETAFRVVLLNDQSALLELDYWGSSPDLFLNYGRRILGPYDVDNKRFGSAVAEENLHKTVDETCDQFYWAGWLCLEPVEGQSYRCVPPEDPNEDPNEIYVTG